MKKKHYQYQKRFRKPRRLRKRRSIVKSRVFWDIVLGLVLLCSLAYFLFFSTVFKLKEIKFISPREVSLKPLQELLNQELQKKWLHLFKRDSFFLLWSREVEDKILRELPEIKTANLRKKFPDGLLLEVKKREPLAIWCGLEEDEQSDGQCFLIDKDRVIFRRAKKEETKGDLFLVMSKEEKQRGILEEACSAEEMNQILEIQHRLQGKLNIGVENFTKGKLGLLEAKTVEGWEIYFDLSTDIELALTKLELLLEEELPLEERKNLQYIDLRFSKVYYK